MLCKSLVPPPRGLILFSDGNRFGSEAAYKCSEGYNLEGGDNVRKCGINGHWSGIEPFCESKKEGGMRGEGGREGGREVRRRERGGEREEGGREVRR